MSPDSLFGLVVLGLLLATIGGILIADRRRHNRWDGIKADRRRGLRRGAKAP